MSVRKEIQDLLIQEWAEIEALAGVRVIATEAALDAMEVPTALIRNKSFGRHPQAPLSHRNVGLLLTLISPHQDLDLAGDQLDELLEGVLDYLDTRFKYEDATAVGYGDYLAFDIPLTILATKSQPETP